MGTTLEVVEYGADVVAAGGVSEEVFTLAEVKEYDTGDVVVVVVVVGGGGGGDDGIVSVAVSVVSVVSGGGGGGGGGGEAIVSVSE
jgi:hypothetical protein